MYEYIQIHASEKILLFYCDSAMINKTNQNILLKKTDRWRFSAEYISTSLTEFITERKMIQVQKSF